LKWKGTENGDLAVIEYDPLDVIAQERSLGF
jgi:hypothetical protein